MFSHMLDTNIVIYVIKRRPLEVLEAFNRYAGKMVISSITYGEWFTGWRTARPAVNARVVEFCLPIGQLITAPKRHRTTATSVAERQGTPIGVNDPYRGHARSGLITVTNNRREFER
ncbi:VapC toxin family PIN domain ribonuclease [Serratia marcescens]|uniref:VapC toxin family PIN domain ribonuclease n=1 Tax=Serratia marcescens TaxID=615 RepID=A0A939NM17_SERMA|nr:VapC toxin family PIN domain ribonuclease [Serratia marcescens]